MVWFGLVLYFFCNLSQPSDGLNALYCLYLTATILMSTMYNQTSHFSGSAFIRAFYHIFILYQDVPHQYVVHVYKIHMYYISVLMYIFLYGCILV